MASKTSSKHNPHRRKTEMITLSALDEKLMERDRLTTVFSSIGKLKMSIYAQNDD
jgi:hypothetical protein